MPKIILLRCTFGLVQIYQLLFFYLNEWSIFPVFTSTKKVKSDITLGLLQLAKAFWMPFDREFGDYASEMQRQSKEIKEEIRLASEQAANRERQLQIAERKSAADFRTFGRLLHNKTDQLSKEDRAWRTQIQERESKAGKQNLLDRLSTYDYIAPLKRERKKRYSTTSQWLSKTDEYDKWLNASEPCCFWLSGILGSGKTVITAAVVDDLLDRQLPEDASLSFSSANMTILTL